MWNKLVIISRIPSIFLSKEPQITSALVATQGLPDKLIL